MFLYRKHHVDLRILVACTNRHNTLGATRTSGRVRIVYMGKDLIIVESPAKVKTIKKFLGGNYVVQASVGHVRDLPTSEIGVDEANGFAPQYKVIEGKQKVVSALREAAAKSDVVYLAPDPDREGEAIAWHVAELIKNKNTNIKRIQFNEITAKAVREALEHPRELNKDLFDAQQARRVLDRLVGYKISPLLWKKIKRGISAGRVQSVALRLIVDRENERRAFTPEEYWLFRAQFAKKADPSSQNPHAEYAPFKAELHKIEGKKPVIPNKERALEIEMALQGNPFVVTAVESKKRERQPQPPFITSTLQQTANQRLGYTAKRTMNIAQRLYEGVDLDDMGTLALITYMRTDSVRISDEAKNATREFILSTWGDEYYPKKERVFKTKDSAQDAHEAIRPVDVTITPDSIKHLLPPEQFQLYRLIWSRFVASQMSAARFFDTTIITTCGITEWRSKGERLLFAGFLRVLPQHDDAETELPPIEEGEHLLVPSLTKEQKFTQPPARYSEASLVRELEEQGIGRPSTYAAIISTLIDRDYAHLEDKHFIPTDLGSTVCSMLTKHFSKLMDVSFTAGMENSLDNVAEGTLDWVALLSDFYADFEPTLEEAAKNMETVKGGIPTDIICELCKKPMVIKFGKAGSFLACSGYPACHNTKNFRRDAQGTIIAEENTETPEYVGTCPDCGAGLVIKKARTGSRFIACSAYPECKHAEPFSTGVPCPKEGCLGHLVEKSSKRGKIFYSCDQFPKCDYALWDWPVPGPCPLCGSPLLVRKSTKAKGMHIACPEKGCRYTQELPDEE